MFGRKQALQVGIATALGLRGHERAGEAGELALVEQPRAQAAFFLADAHCGLAVQCSGLQHGIDQRLGVARPQAQRIAWFVGQAGTVEGKLEMAHVLPAGTESDALVGEYRGGERLGA